MRIPLIIVLALTISACSNKTVSKQELINYVLDETNGLAFVKTIQEIQVEALYLPNELTKEVNSNMTEISNSDEDVDLVFFRISISKNGEEILSSYAGKVSRYNEISNNLFFNTEKLVYLLNSDEKKINPVYAISFPTYGMSNENTITAAFNKGEMIDSESVDLWIQMVGKLKQ